MGIMNLNQWRKKRADFFSNNRNNLPKFSTIAVGDGGLNPDGAVKDIDGAATSLNNELKRKSVTASKIDDFTYKYAININTDGTDSDLIGKKISEFGIIDSENSLAIVWNKEFTPVLTAGFNQNIELVIEED